MPTDNGQKFRDEWVRFWAPDADVNATAIADSALQRIFAYESYQSDLGATTNNSTMLDASVDIAFIVTSVKVSVSANVTSDNTNNAVFSLVYNNGNGGSDTTIATINTATTAGGGTGNITKDTPTTVTITAANSRVPAGQSVYWKVTKQGAGGLAVHHSFAVKARPIQ
jgi:hypothetical protein